MVAMRARVMVTIYMMLKAGRGKRFPNARRSPVVKSANRITTTTTQTHNTCKHLCILHCNIPKLYSEILERSVSGFAEALQLNLATALEDLRVAIGGEAQGVPKSHRRLHAQLSLQGGLGGFAVQGLGVQGLRFGVQGLGA